MKRVGARPAYTLLRDVLVVAAITFAGYLCADELGLAPRLSAWLSSRSEPLRSVELLIGTMALVLALLLFSVISASERRSESARRESLESRYRQLVERVPAITYVWDAGGEVGRDRADFISPQVREILGYSVAEWQSDPDIWRRRVHEDDLDRVMGEWSRALEGGTAFACEYRMHAKDGRLVWVRDEAVSVPADDGRALLQGVMLDITERRHVEEQLRAAESRYRSLVERIPTLTYIEEIATGNFTYVSPQVERMLGFSPQEFLVPGVWQSRIHPDDVDRVLDADRRSDSTGEDFDIEYRILAKDGREVWVEEHTELMEGADGGEPFWLGVIADITERKLSEERVRRAERRYRKLVERLPAVVYVDAADEQATALYISPRYEELLGYSWEERLAQPDLWLRLLHPDDRGRVIEESNRTNRTGEPFICDYRLTRKDGRVVWVRDHAYLVEGEGDGPRVWQGVLLDITDQKAAEEELRRRDAILPAVGFAAQRFLTEPDWERSIDEILAHLGEAADVSRVYLFENARAEGGDLRATERFEWAAAPGVRPTLGGPNTRDWSYAATGCGRWADVLGRGDILRGAPSSMPEPERRRLEDEGIRSLLVVPVVVGEDWWGFLGFDECRVEREWTALEVEALKAAADILGTAIRRQLAEQRLAETEAQFRTLVEQLPAITYIDSTREPWRTIYVSPQLETVLGYTQEEWRRVPGAWEEALHADDRARVLEAVAEHIATGAPYEAEYRLRTKDGRWVWIRDQARVVVDEGGEETYSQGVMFDITSRRESEEQLREAEERFRVLVEQSPAMLYIETPNPSAPSLYVSPHVEQIFGVPADEYVSDVGVWERLVHPDDRRQAREGYEGSLAAGRPWSLEYRVVRPDGRTIWVRDECALTKNDAGDVVLVQGVVYDITERKLAEQTLIESERREREAADRLRALDEMKNTFLAAVSHELRSPLTSILGLALTLERQDQISDDDREDLLGRLATNARKLDRLLKDLLDIDRLSRGIVTPQYRLTDIGSLVRRTVENLDAIGGRQIFVHTEPVLIHVDPAKIERIVENLVVNAARHTSEGTRIWVRVAPKDGGALVVVEDDGPGVPAESRSAIFEPFRQGPNVSKANPGTGIGLSLVARFAELHGGRAWAEDREGGGASFGVFLPGSPDPRERPIATGTGAA